MNNQVKQETRDAFLEFIVSQYRKERAEYESEDGGLETLSKLQFALRHNVSPATMETYLNGRSIPNWASLVKLEQEFPGIINVMVEAESE